MEIECKKCGETIVVADDIVPRQHIRCPYCNEKFAYAAQNVGISEEDLRTALEICRRDGELNIYYRNAPQGARLYIALVFYGKVFKDRLDRDAYVRAFAEIGEELKERDLRYLLQNEDDKVMREYLSDRLASLVGRSEIPPKDASDSRKAKLGVIRPATTKPIQVNPEFERRNAAIERKETARIQSERLERRRKIVCAIVNGAIICAVLIVGWIVYSAWQDRGAPSKETEFSEATVKESRNVVTEERIEKAENSEDVRPVPSEVTSEKPVERQMLIDAFLMYLEREKVSLTNIVIGSTVAYDEIIADQKRLSDALAEIDKENVLRTNRALTNGWIRYEKPEVVMMVLKHRVINDLATKYIGEDFSALCNSCRAKIKSVMQLHREEEQLLAENRRKYQQTVQGDDERVSKKLEKADSMRVAFNKGIDRCVSERKAQLASKQEVLLQLKSNPSQTSSVMNERVVVEADILRLQKEITDLERFAESGKASAAHVAATYAESATRQRADHALSERQDNDNAVRMRMEHERDLFAIAMEYEGRSLDRIGVAMQSRREVLLTRMSDAKAKLDDLNRTSLNADFLTDSQLKSIREKIGMKIESRLLNHAQ